MAPALLLFDLDPGALPFAGFCCVYAVFLVFGLAALAFWIWMLVDCATKEPSQGNDKIVWVLVISLTSWIGALIYFFARRPQRIREHGR
jgi:Phospholipase_D-nuclease N-terminal